MKWKDLSLKERKQIYDSVRANNPDATYLDIKQQFDSIPEYEDGKDNSVAAVYSLPEVNVYPQNRFGDIARSQGYETAKNWQTVRNATTAGINEFVNDPRTQFVSAALPMPSGIEVLSDAINIVKSVPKSKQLFYHGSPVRFDKFDAQFIGSAEGGSKAMKGINLWHKSPKNAPKFANIKSPDAPIHLGRSSKPLGGELNPTVYDVVGTDLNLYKTESNRVKELLQSNLEALKYDGIQTPSQTTVFPGSVNKLKIVKKQSIPDFIKSHPEVDKWTQWTTNEELRNLVESKIPAYEDGKGKTINKADLPPEYRTGTPEYFERQRKISGAVNTVQPEAYITPAGYILPTDINDYNIILDNNIYMPGTANHELGHVADGLAGSRKIQDFDSGKEYITNTYLNYLANSNNTYSSAELRKMGLFDAAGSRSYLLNPTEAKSHMLTLKRSLKDSGKITNWSTPVDENMILEYMRNPTSNKMVKNQYDLYRNKNEYIDRLNKLIPMEILMPLGGAGFVGHELNKE